MKTRLISTVLCLAALAAAKGQVAQPDASSAAPTSTAMATPAAGTETPYSVVQRDANSRVWRKLSYESTPSGGVFARRHEDTELTTGMHFMMNAQWLETSEAIQPLPAGMGAAATNG